MKNILVTGGAGYIGSFMVRHLLDEGYQVTVVDSLQRGKKSYIAGDATFLQGDLLDRGFLNDVFKNKYDSVIHFAAFISVAESMQNPYLYFQNNVFATLNLLEMISKNKIKNIVFSSTAGVYGTPEILPIPEDHQRKPESPYGESKLMAENILKWYQQVNGISFAILRYFNAAGAAIDGSLGEYHIPESHIIPNAINAALQNKIFNIFGNDYPTKDGTCIRDYIHVLDLAKAHILALNMLEQKPGGYIYNVGTGRGYSNQEVVDMVRKVSGRELKIIFKSRRPGDPAVLIANAAKINQELNFKPEYSELETIINSAWLWHSNKLNSGSEPQ